MNCLTKMLKYHLKLKPKVWITAVIHQSILVKKICLRNKLN